MPIPLTVVLEASCGIQWEGPVFSHAFSLALRVETHPAENVSVIVQDQAYPRMASLANAPFHEATVTEVLRALRPSIV